MNNKNMQSYAENNELLKVGAGLLIVNGHKRLYFWTSKIYI